MSIINDPVCRLAEIFHSIQGESLHQGLPCIFIRFHGCNLNCVWCDTPAADYPPFEMPVSRLVESIRQWEPCKLVEITGGEPLLQASSRYLMQALIDNGNTVLLETNGSVSLLDVPDEVVKIVDVKCPDSGEAGSFDIGNLSLLDPNRDQLKFVIASERDFDYACDFLRQYNLQGGQVIVSPVQSRISPRELGELILRSGFQVRLQLQLHKAIWGTQAKGV